MRKVILALGAAVCLAGCGGDGSNADQPYPLPHGSEPVQLDPADFVERVDTAFWPMAPGSKWVYRETDAEGNSQRVEVTVTEHTKTILGIDATVVHDQVTEDGELIEDTLDWYAQDKWGGLWYLGEKTAEYESGKVKSTEGSWEAGVDGAQPGYIIPPNPEVGMSYRQEYYAGEAEDRGEILSLGAEAEVPLGNYDHALKTRDTTPLEPDVVEEKFYAKGVGPVLTTDKSGGREELLRFTRG